jgi:hypothetical protein
MKMNKAIMGAGVLAAIAACVAKAESMSATEAWGLGWLATGDGDASQGSGQWKVDTRLGDETVTTWTGDAGDAWGEAILWNPATGQVWVWSKRLVRFTDRGPEVWANGQWIAWEPPQVACAWDAQRQQWWIGGAGLAWAALPVPDEHAAAQDNEPDADWQ